VLLQLSVDDVTELTKSFITFVLLLGAACATTDLFVGLPCGVATVERVLDPLLTTHSIAFSLWT
jgi:hypothetical protein